MSWAGSKGILQKVRSLLRFKQAPSVSSNEDASIAAAVRSWEESKAYLLAESNPSKCAQRMGITTAQLYNYCLKVKGEDFRTWRTRLRINEAKKQLLEEPKTPVSVIARRVGINDRSNFSRLFKEHTGVLPTEWRGQK